MFAAADLAEVKPLLATSRMPGYHATPILPLARDKVRYVGEPVVGIVAESRYLAEDALELVDIDYEPLPVVIDPEAAVRGGAPLLHEGAGTNVLVAREFKRGDAEAAIEDAAVRVKGRFRMRRKTAMAIEPRVCVAEYDKGRDALTLHSRRRKFPASCATASRRRLILPGIASAWSRRMSAAGLAARALCTPKRFSSAPRRAGSDVRSNGPVTGWKTSPRPARVSTRSWTPSLPSTKTAVPWPCRPMSSATSAPIRSIHGPARSSRCRW